MIKDALMVSVIFVIVYFGISFTTLWEMTTIGEALQYADNWNCTRQHVEDATTMPHEFECVQWTKKESK